MMWKNRENMKKMKDRQSLFRCFGAEPLPVRLREGRWQAFPSEGGGPLSFGVVIQGKVV